MLANNLSGGDLEPAMQGLSSEEPVIVLPCRCSRGSHKGLEDPGDARLAGAMCSNKSSCDRQIARAAPVDERVWREVPVSLLKKSWKVASRWRWKCCVHAARSTSCHHEHLGVLGDSLTVGGVVSHFRSHGKELLHVTQSIAAHLSGANIFMHHRLIPSEWIVADGPSRNVPAASRSRLLPGSAMLQRG